MNIAMIGQKGIPASWGGVEQHVDHLSRRLAAEGHAVFVYARRQYVEPRVLQAFNRKHKRLGLTVVPLPTIPSKHLDTILHTFLATVHAIYLNADIYHFHSVGPSLLSWMPRLFRPHARVITTFHCVDRFHQKWGFFARLTLRIGEWAAVTFAHRTITVSKELQQYCALEYNAETAYIPNGVPEARRHAPALIRSTYGLTGNDYLLVVSRFVPHKGIQYLIKAFRTLTTTKKLVIVGGSAHTDAHERELHRLAKGDARILFTGYQTGRMLAELFSNCYLYVQPSETEGLSLAVLEAASYGRGVLTSDIPANIEIIGRAGSVFRSGDVRSLRAQLRLLLADAAGVAESGRLLRQHVRKHYRWEQITKAVLHVYEDALAEGAVAAVRFVKGRV